MSPKAGEVLSGDQHREKLMITGTMAVTDSEGGNKDTRPRNFAKSIHVLAG